MVGRVLGHGGFGITYLGVDANLDLRVAIKEFMPRELASRKAETHAVIPYTNARNVFHTGIEKFLDEGRALARFQNHPNIVSVNSFFRENGTGYLVMEYMEGQSLEEIRVAHHGVLPEATVLPWILQTLEGLRAIHQVQMLHRDIKPQNIYLTSEGQIKVLDFGSARYASGGAQPLTQMWTAGFAPPEQCGGGEGEQGPWTDIYGVGATLYILLTGQLPADAILRLRGDDTMLSPQEILGSHVSPHVSHAVMKSLAITPHERFATAEHFLAALQQQPMANVLPSHQIPLVSDSPPSPYSSQSSDSLHSWSMPAISKEDIAQKDPYASSEVDVEYIPPQYRSFWSWPLTALILIVGSIVGIGAVSGWFSASKKQVNPNKWESRATTQTPQPRPQSPQPQPQSPQPQAVVPIVKVYRSIRQAHLFFRQRNYNKAAAIYHRLRYEVPLPVPMWKLLAWQSKSRARSNQVQKAESLLKQAESAYITWKKGLRATGVGLRSFLRWNAHKVMGEARWYVALATSGKTQAYHWGQIWSDWTLSSYAGRAESRWWKFVSQHLHHIPLPRAQLFRAAERYCSLAYRHCRRSLRLYQYLAQKASKSHYRCLAKLEVAWVYTKLKQWTKAIQQAKQVLSTCSSRRNWRSRWHYRTKRARARRYLAISSYYRYGLSAFGKALLGFTKRDRKEIVRTLNHLAFALNEQGKTRLAIRMFRRSSKIAKRRSRQISALWHMGFTQYTAKKYQAAYNTFIAIQKKLRTRDYKGYIATGYWAAQAGEHSGDQSNARRLYQEICKNYPLNFFGMQACKKLGRTLPQPPSMSPQSWTPVGQNKERYAALKQAQESLGMALELTRQLSQVKNPAVGLINEAATAYNRLARWQTSFYIIKSYRMSDLYKNRVSRKIWRAAFPRPQELWPTIQRTAHAHNLQAALLEALIRREGDFYPKFRLFHRVGLTGTNPQWSTTVTTDINKNLQTGAARLQKLKREFSALGAVLTAYRGHETVLRQALRTYPKVPVYVLGKVLSAVGDPVDYAYAHTSGAYWYYQVYRWLY